MTTVGSASRLAYSWASPYFVIVVDSTHLELAATYKDAIAGNAIALNGGNATATSNTIAAGQADDVNQARSTVSTNAPASPASSVGSTAAAGTTASIDNGGTISAHTVDVNATQTMTIAVGAGGGGFGVDAGIGLGLAVLTVQSDVNAYIGPSVTIDGLAGTGALSVMANRGAAYNVLGIAGSGSGAVALGSAVSVVNDTSHVFALTGADVVSGAVISATATTPTVVGGAGFASVTVGATHTATTNLAVGAGGIAGIASLGAAVLSADLATTAAAQIGDYTTIGTAGTPVGSVSLTASDTQFAGPFNAGQPMSIALFAALGGSAAAGVDEVTLKGTTTASIGQHATVNATGAVTVSATGSDTGNGSIDGGAIGALAVGFILADFVAAPTVTAIVGASSDVVTTTGTLSIIANGTAGVTDTGTPAAGGIFAGAGGNVVAEADPIVNATVGAGATGTSHFP
jgi:hypothetical protein